MIYIFDLDGTLADPTHRLHHLQRHYDGDKPRWDEFFAACPADQPIWPTIALANLIWYCDTPEFVAHIWIWSGRSQVVRDETEEWLRRHGVPYDELIMRPEGDHRPDHELKLGWWKNTRPADQQAVFGVFEDRRRLVNMWRSLGLTCYHVADGDF